MNPTATRTDTEINEELYFDEGEDYEPDTSHPDFQAVALTMEDIRRNSADIKAERIKTIPWSEVEAGLDAISHA